MDPQNNQLPQQPTDNVSGGVPPTPPQPGQQFAPQQPGMVTPSVQPGQPQPVGQPFTPQPDTGYPTGAPTGGGNKTKLRVIVLLVTLLVVAALVAVSYFAFFKKDENADDAAKKSASNSADAKNAVDMATLDNVTLDLATAPEGFTAKADPAPNVKQFSQASDERKQTCEFLIGTISAASLPGENLEAIVKPQMDLLRSRGATVDGPNAGDALIVKDATDSKVTYSMPTLNFKFNYEGNEAVVHYSAVILKSGERAVVNRTCSQVKGSVDMNRIKALDAASKNITVTKK